MICTSTSEEEDELYTLNATEGEDNKQKMVKAADVFE